MKLYLLPPERIEEWWPRAQPLIQKVLDYPLGPDLYDWWDVYSDIKNTASLCLVAEDWRFLLVACVKTYPKARVLDVYLAAGEDNSGTEWADVDLILEELCKVFGCKYLTVTGRRGWEKALKPLGYTFGNIKLMKEVDNVHLPNDGDAPPGSTD